MSSSLPTPCAAGKSSSEENRNPQRWAFLFFSFFFRFFVCFFFSRVPSRHRAAFVHRVTIFGPSTRIGANVLICIRPMYLQQTAFSRFCARAAAPLCAFTPRAHHAPTLIPPLVALEKIKSSTCLLAAHPPFPHACTLDNALHARLLGTPPRITRVGWSVGATEKDRGRWLRALMCACVV